MTASSSLDARRAGRDEPARGRPWWVAAGVDVLLVLVFVVIGRSAHQRGLPVEGIARTAWPFVAGLAVGWVATGSWRRPWAPWPTGTAVTASCVGWGMALRAVDHQGVDGTFVVVATCFLTLFVVGWRVGVAGWGRWRRRVR